MDFLFSIVGNRNLQGSTSRGLCKEGVLKYDSKEVVVVTVVGRRCRRRSSVLKRHVVRRKKSRRSSMELKRSVVHEIIHEIHSIH